MSLIASPSDIIAGQCAIAAWFIAVAVVMLISNRHLRGQSGGFFNYLGLGSLAIGLPLAFVLPSSAYLLKSIVMLVFSICISVMGLKNGSRWYAWLGLLAAFFAYVAIGFQYMVVETAR
ncbi:hypothetical protein [Xanthomonas arboricola]|uniref:hypothetical protein n=1 Tax=Xanthomonas arboricola TaxID=56448 RepID=UPI0004D9DAE7|nr:hypothetical protein [Xanthomonas arboricola]KER88218.1 hypothetical protein GW16_02255 [Xanthomonas arboricola pv. celebensis]MBB6257617.1 hypothetical protein [Xanthomonas arboricola]CAD2242670.1 hypothetical protein X12_000159 [Xanthomonas arboricola]